jgi:cellulose synthase (UDP-forming)
LPPDLFLRARQTVPLLLKYEYSGAPPESLPKLHVRVNGKDIDSISLKPTPVSISRSETVRIPTDSLLPYTNTLSIDFYFERNVPPSTAQTSFAIDRESTLDLSGIPHSVVLPRLELFADGGYPYTEWPDLSRTAVVMPANPPPSACEALLDIAGFFGAQTGSLTTALTVINTGHLDRARDKDLVLIGTADSQPLLRDWAASMPLDLSGQKKHLNQAAAPSSLLHPGWPFHNYDRDRLSRLIDGGVPIDTVVESFVSPLHADRLVVAIVPADSGGDEALRALFTPSERQGPVYGGVAVSQNGRFQSFVVGSLAYQTGNLDRFQHLRVLLLEYYEFIPLFVLLLAAMIAAWVRRGTERVAARRLAECET